MSHTTAAKTARAGLMDAQITALLAVTLAFGAATMATAGPPAEIPNPLPLAPPSQGPSPPEWLPPGQLPSPARSGTTTPPAENTPPSVLPPGLAQPAIKPVPPTPSPSQPKTEPVKVTLEPAGTKPSPQDRVGPPDAYWGAISYLSYQFKSAPLAGAGLIETDASGTRTVIGNQSASFGWANGLSLDGGLWLNNFHTFGVGLGGFLTEQRSWSTEVAAGPNQTLTRPFINALTNEPAQFFVATPGFLTGSYRVDSTARLGGADAYFVRNLTHEKEYTINLLAGFRYLDLEETLLMTQNTAATGTGVILLGGNTYQAGIPLTITDRFLTRNQFYGGEVGLNGEWRYGPACFAITPKVGFGTVHETVLVSGESQVPGVTIPGGFFGLPGGNAGRNGANRFTLLTELRAEVGVYLTGHTRLSVGYDFLYLNDVARPAGQIDSVVNPRLVPTSRSYGGLSGVASPVPIAGATDFLAHGIRVTLELRY